MRSEGARRLSLAGQEAPNEIPLPHFIPCAGLSPRLRGPVGRGKQSMPIQFMSDILTPTAAVFKCRS